MAGGILGTAVGYLSLDASGFALGVDSAISGMDKLENRYGSLATGLQTIGGNITRAGSVLASTITAPVIAFGAASIKAGADFDESMAYVQAVSKATGDDITMIRDRALEMGETTRYTAKEAADAMYYMGLAGWDAQQIYKGIPGVMALAAASGEDLSRVSDIVTDSLTAFGKSAEDTGEFVNVLAEASRSSNTTVDLLGQSFKYVAPIAGSFGYSIQDTATALGLMANMGVKGTQAGTSLRQGLNSMIKPSEAAAMEMEKYGLSLFNADGSTKSLMEVMQQLRSTFGNLGVDIYDANGELKSGEAIMEEYGSVLPTNEMEKLTSLTKIFTVRALPGMLAVINSTEEDFNKLSESINGAQDSYEGLGTAFGMQEQTMDTLKGDWYYLTSAIGTAKIIISDMANGALRDLTQRLTDMVNAFNDMDPDQQERIIKNILRIATIGPALMILGRLISSVGTIIGAIQGLGIAFQFIFSQISNGINWLSTSITSAFGFIQQLFGGTVESMGAEIATMENPIGAVILIVTMLVLAFRQLWENSEEFRDRISGAINQVMEAGQRLVDGVQEHMNFITATFEFFRDTFIDIWNALTEFLAPVFTWLFDTVADTVDMIVDVILGILEMLEGLFEGDWLSFFEGLGNATLAILNWIWDLIKNLITGLWETFLTWLSYADKSLGRFGRYIINSVKSVLTTLGYIFWELIKIPFKALEWLGNQIIDAVKSIWYFILGFINTIIDGVSDFISWLVEGVQGLWDTITTNLGHFVTAVRESVGNLIDRIQRAVTTFLYNGITKIVSTLQGFIRNVKKVFGDIREFFENGIKTIISKVYTFVRDVVRTVVETIDTIVDAVTEFIDNFIDNIVDFVNSVADTIAEFVDDVIDGFVNMFNTVVDGVTEFVDDVVTGFKNMATDAWAEFTGLLSKVVGWVTDMVDKAKNMVSRFVTTIIDNIKELPGKFKSHLDGIIDNVMNWGTDLITEGITAVTNMVNKIKDKLSEFVDDFVTIGKDFIKGIWEGINSMVDWLGDKISGFGNKIVKGAKKIFKINSPSKVFRDEIGKWLPAGIAEGFDMELPMTMKVMADEFNKDLGILESRMDAIKMSGMYLGDVDYELDSYNNSLIDYDLMADKMAEKMRETPIQNNVSVEMTDGDVYLDKERVGRTVAPVVSRVQATSN